MITLVGIISIVAVVLLLMYTSVGLVMTYELRKGIKKIWVEEDELKDHQIFGAYLTVIICWPWVDWDHVECQNNWAITIEVGKENHETEV